MSPQTLLYMFLLCFYTGLMGEGCSLGFLVDKILT